MAYTAVPTKPDGDGKKLTLVDWNTHIKGSIDYLRAVLAGTESDKIAAAALAAEAWWTWTANLYQGGSVAYNTTAARWRKLGRLGILQLNIQAAAAGAAGAPLQIYGIVAALAPYDINGVCGSFLYIDAGGTPPRYTGTVIFGGGADSLEFVCNEGGLFGVSPAVTIANMDVLRLQIAFETAS